MVSKENARMVGILTSLMATMMGILIFVMWIYAAEDGSDETNPRGWFKKVKDEGASEYDCHDLMIAFAVILGLAWILSGIFGFFVSKAMDWKVKVYLIIAIVIYVVFASVFSAIVVKVGNFLLPFYRLIEKFKKEVLVDNTNRNIYRSSDTFISISIIAFMVGASQIAGALFVWLAKDETLNDTSVSVTANNIIMTTTSPVQASSTNQ